MDFRVTETAISACEILADAVSEQPVDGDFVLPEYCPDVAAVLKCQLTATVQSRQVSTDRLLADGTVHIHVLYLDEERRCVRCCDFSQPFSAAFSVPSLPQNAFIYLQPKTDYVNCRAVSPRRLDIHGAFSLKLRVIAPSEQPVITAIEGEGVYSRHCMLSRTVPAAFAEKPMTINEVVDVGAGHHAAQTILQTLVTPVITDCKVLLNKAILKGVLRLYVLYVIDVTSGATETAEAEVPFSQIMDMEGLNEEWICDADVTALSYEVSVDSSQSGDSVLLAVSVKLLSSLCGWKYDGDEAVCDAYSAHCPLIMETQQVETAQLQGVWRDEPSVRQVCELPAENVQDILGVWSSVVSAGMSGEDEVHLDGRVLWCMLVKDDKGEVSYYERAENFSLPYNDRWRDDTPEVRVCHTDFQITGNGKMELRADLAVTRRCTKTDVHTVLRHASPDEMAAYPPDKAALKIVYAEKGESLWDIARRSRTSVEAIMEENHLSGESLSADTMLLIPLC